MTKKSIMILNKCWRCNFAFLSLRKKNDFRGLFCGCVMSVFTCLLGDYLRKWCVEWAEDPDGGKVHSARAHYEEIQCDAAADDARLFQLCTSACIAKEQLRVSTHANVTDLHIRFCFSKHNYVRTRGRFIDSANTSEIQWIHAHSDIAALQLFYKRPNIILCMVKNNKPENENGRAYEICISWLRSHLHGATVCFNLVKKLLYTDISS